MGILLITRQLGQIGVMDRGTRRTPGQRPLHRTAPRQIRHHESLVGGVEPVGQAGRALHVGQQTDVALENANQALLPTRTAGLRLTVAAQALHQHRQGLAKSRQRRCSIAQISLRHGVEGTNFGGTQGFFTHLLTRSRQHLGCHALGRLRLSGAQIRLNNVEIAARHLRRQFRRMLGCFADTLVNFQRPGVITQRHLRRKVGAQGAEHGQRMGCSTARQHGFQRRLGEFCRFGIAALLSDNVGQHAQATRHIGRRAPGPFQCVLDSRARHGLRLDQLALIEQHLRQTALNAFCRLLHRLRRRRIPSGGAQGGQIDQRQLALPLTLAVSSFGLDQFAGH